MTIGQHIEIQQAERLRAAIKRVEWDAEVVAIRAAALLAFSQPIPELKPYRTGFTEPPVATAVPTARPHTRIGIST
jgi:hypothetical protein